MGFKNREIEKKFTLTGADLNWVTMEIDKIMRAESHVRRFGSSNDTYFTVGDPNVVADFARVRERDGIRQLTVKGKDKGSNDDRVEIDIDCTSPTSTILKFFTALLGPTAGIVGKSYYVWETSASEYDTVTAYTVDTDESLKNSVILEFEARTMAGVERLERLVLDSLRQHANIKVERAKGSLYELCILKEF
jgi:hypothetical protein